MVHFPILSQTFFPQMQHSHFGHLVTPLSIWAGRWEVEGPPRRSGLHVGVAPWCLLAATMNTPRLKIARLA